MSLKKTPLNTIHHQLGGRMVPFSGWEMPVQYSSILQEHQGVRKNAGLFDVSHMGEIIVKGNDAEKFLESLTCNRVCDIADGQVQYNAVLNENGGLVDDITIYREGQQNFFVVSNASNYETVTSHFLAYKKGNDVSIENISDTIHQIAIQGPLAEKITLACLKIDFSAIGYYKFADFQFEGKKIRVSRTGYTGEDGFELYTDVTQGVDLWNRLLETGKSDGIIPAGLGARDLLRLEARYALYGHELNTEWTPVESGIGWIVKEKPSDFPGYTRTLEHKTKGVANQVQGFKLLESGVPREGYECVDASGNPCGKVLSGGFSPIISSGIGTAFLPANTDTFSVQIRDKRIPAQTHKKAFVQGTAGKPWKDRK